MRGSPSLRMGYSVQQMSSPVGLSSRLGPPSPRGPHVSGRCDPVGAAARAPLRRFAAPALVRGSAGRQAPGGLRVETAPRIAAAQIVAGEVPLAALETMATQHSFAS